MGQKLLWAAVSADQLTNMHGIFFSVWPSVFALSGTLLGSSFSACFPVSLCRETVATAYVQQGTVHLGTVLKVIDSGQATCVQ